MQTLSFISYKRHRFPPQIIAHAVWLYTRFNRSLRGVGEILFEQRIEVSYETVRRWTLKFEPQIARHLRRRQARLGDIWHLDDALPGNTCLHVREGCRQNSGPEILALEDSGSKWAGSRGNPAESPLQNACFAG